MHRNNQNAIDGVDILIKGVKDQLTKQRDQLAKLKDLRRTLVVAQQVERGPTSPSKLDRGGEPMSLSAIEAEYWVTRDQVRAAIEAGEIDVEPTESKTKARWQVPRRMVQAWAKKRGIGPKRFEPDIKPAPSNHGPADPHQPRRQSGDPDGMNRFF